MKVRWTKGRIVFVCVAVVVMGTTLMLVREWCIVRKKLSAVRDALLDEAYKSRYSKYDASYDDLKFGESELAKIMRARPAMRAYVCDGDPIWFWTVCQLAGERTGFRVRWNDSTCPKVTHGTSSPRGHWVRIQDADSEGPLSGDEMWAALVFELHNLRKGKAFARADLDAYDGTCSKEQYVRTIESIEFRSAHETAAFYRDVWLPMCKSKDLKTSPEEWFADESRGFEECSAKADRSYLKHIEDNFDGYAVSHR